MSVDFEWQVGHEEELKTPSPPLRRRRRIPWRQVGIACFLLAVAVGIAAVVFWQRAREGEARIKRDLEVAVNRDAQAVRNRIPEQFPFADNVGALELGLETKLAVLDVGLIPEDCAWAEAAWALDDGIYRRVHFYRYLNDDWQQADMRREYFGAARTHETAHFILQYMDRDEPTVGWMAEQFEDWYEAICADLDCGGEPRISVKIILQGQVTRLGPPEGFTVRSPRLRAVREDGAPLPQEQVELARMLALLLSSRQAGGVDTIKQPYLLPQLANWHVRRLGLAGENTPPTPVLDYLMTSHGLEGMRALLEAMRRTTSETRALNQTLGVDLVTLGDVFDQYLVALLAVERQVMTWETTEPVAATYHSLAESTYQRLLAPTVIGGGRNSEWWQRKMRDFDDWRVAARLGRAVTSSNLLSYPQVQWVEVGDDWACAEVSDVHLRRIESFQHVVGAWRHAPPAERCLGEPVVLTSAHWRVECHEREVPLTAGQLAQLESYLEAASRDLQMSLPEDWHLTVQLVVTDSVGYVADPSVVKVTSPWVTGLADGGGWSLEERVGILQRLALLRTGNSGFVFPSASSYVWVRAVANWHRAYAEDHLDHFARAWAFALHTAVEAGGLIPLKSLTDDLSVRLSEFATVGNVSEEGRVPVRMVSEIDVSGESSREVAGLVQNLILGEAESVIHYVMEVYGPEMLPAVIDALDEASFSSRWLELALDVDLETFEADWRAWLSEQVRR